MPKNKQMQKAGDNSHLLQAETINIFANSDEKNIREIHPNNSEDKTSEMHIYIDSSGKILNTPDSLITMTKWIADGCPPNVNISVQDERISQHELECNAAEESIVMETSNTMQASNRLFNAHRNLQYTKYVDKKLADILSYFVKVNYKYSHIDINNIDDLMLFIESLQYYIEVGKNKHMNDNNYIAVDFTLKQGIYKDQYYFVVPIKISSILATGLSDNLGFRDIILLDYRHFDKDTKREIVAIFCQDLEWMASEAGKNLWADEDVQNLFCYELGLH